MGFCTKILQSLIAIVLICSTCYGEESKPLGSQLKMELLVEPTQWDAPNGKIATSILIVWKVTNFGDRAINFRGRNLGEIEIRDRSGNVLVDNVGGTDGQTNTCERDYPVVGPGDTIYVPINADLFNEKGHLEFWAETSYEGDGGYLTLLQKGKYQLTVTYFAKTPSEDESRNMRAAGVNSYWIGTVKSKTFDISVK